MPHAPLGVISLQIEYRILNTYFHRLGVLRPTIPPSRNLNTSKASSRKENIREKASKTEILKQDLGQADSSLSRRSAPQHVNKENGRAKVGFAPCVTVHSIPNCKDYSQRMKQLLWVPARELGENLQRNHIEFASEQWDWRCAVEEKDFVMIQGVLVHPVHAEILYQRHQEEEEQRFQHQQQSCNLNRQFCMLLSEQQRRSLFYEEENATMVGYR